MHYIQPRGLFDAKDIMLRARFPLTPLPKLVRVLLYGSGAVGYTLGIVVFLLGAMLDAPNHTLMWILSFSSVLPTVGFSAVFFAMYQRSLFHKLCGSFDFLFLSVQLTVGLLCAADMMQWDFRCSAMLSLWIWIHWVLLTDALTPCAKRRLGFKVKFTLPVLLIAVVCEVAMLVEIAFSTRVHLSDRVLIKREVFGHTVEFRMIPLFVSRLVTIFFWSCRLLWRIHNGDDHAMIVLQGRMFYENYLMFAQNRKSLAVTASPIPHKYRVAGAIKVKPRRS